MPTAKNKIDGRRISVAIIVRDAEDVLARSLANLDRVADEIVVLDTGSVDDSVRIARRYGTKVIEAPWTDDFSAARNAALEACTGDWVLWLDAGERLPDDTAVGLRAFVDAGADENVAHLLTVEMPPAAPEASAEGIAQIRLMPRLSMPVFSGRVRETPRPALLTAGLRIEMSPWRIHRSVRDHDPRIKEARSRRNLLLVEKQIADNGADSRMLVCRGEAHMTLGARRKAAADFYQALRLSQRGSVDMLEAYYGLLTTFVGDSSDRDQQLAICVEALEVFPLDAQLLCAMGNYLQAQDRLDLAARSFQAALEQGAVEPEAWHLCEIRATAAICQSVICQLQGNQEAAESVLEAALDRLGDAPKLRKQLIHLYVKRGRLDAALGQFNLLPPETPHREALRSAVRGACRAAEKNWVPALAYLETAHTAGCRDPLCLKWLFLALISTDKQDEAVSILNQWHEIEPASAEVAEYLAALESHQGSNNTQLQDLAGEDSSAPPDRGPTKTLRVDTSDNHVESGPVRISTPQSSLSDEVSEPPANV